MITVPERIERPIYLNKLMEFKDKDIVKIVTGIRRCGKSTLLDLYEDYLLSTEFSTLLSGRYVEIRLLPLSFAEFLTF